MENDALTNLEAQAGIGAVAGETPPQQQQDATVDPAVDPTPIVTMSPEKAAREDALEQKLGEAYRLTVRPVRIPDDAVKLRSGFELVAGVMPAEQHKALTQWVMRYRITEDDPTWGEYLAGSVAFSSAQAAQQSAEVIVGAVEKLPRIVQDAFIYAQRDVRAGLGQVFTVSGGEFVRAIKQNIADAAETGAEKLKGAATMLDGELTRAIELRKSDGVELWARKAMEAAELAIAKHKAVNFYFNTTGGVSIFILGAVFGAYLATHV